MTNEEIREAVETALVTAFSSITKNQKPVNPILKWIKDVYPVGMLALFGWLLLAAVSVQKDIIELKHQMREINSNITTHAEVTSDKAMINAVIHHTANVSPCNGCHTISGVKNNPSVQHELDEIKTKTKKK